MIIVYGRMDCPDCVNAKKNLEANGISYEFKNIGESILEMKKFLKLRDTNDIFNSIKGSGQIGIPAFVLEDDSVVLDWENYLIGIGKKVDSSGSSCSIDGTGC